MKLYTIDTGFFKLDGGAMFGVVPKSIWQKTNPADSNNLCTWATRLLLIEDGKRLTLVDTALGDKQDAKFFGHYFLHGDDTLDKSLAKYGFHREDITDVILTHLHFDHCGGAIVREGEKLVPAFKNARFWSNEKHWNWATINPNPREKASFLKENILPIQESGQLNFLSEEQPQYDNSITMRYAYGHTEAMMLPQIHYKGKTLLYMADLLPSIGHIPLAYVMSYDVRPLVTMDERKSYWQEIVDNEYILILEHDAQHECCTLQHTEKGIRLKDTFRLSDIV
ncbi:MBL fold metallo-hydrolase [Sphingobacterium hotanense]|uniref:MBL fold metallo-hydrolase n=1 Tax=Sphingobacterium hotanense TaxID=649196 RepID=A0ABT7NRA2_9SPHI|nr:MBL fold metallo-hydrolase [Sphingobacterium hotanense]MDM1049767.1 MBL fold metallo-hydrolase [Sphingobacterium hotanense]